MQGASRSNAGPVGADSRSKLAEIGVGAARDILNFIINSIHVLGEDDRLVPVAVSDAARELVGDAPAVAVGDGITGRVFESGDPRTIGDAPTHPDVYNPKSPVRSELYLPLGDKELCWLGPQSSMRSTTTISCLVSFWPRTSLPRSKR